MAMAPAKIFDRSVRVRREEEEWEDAEPLAVSEKEESSDPSGEDEVELQDLGTAQLASYSDDREDDIDEQTDATSESDGEDLKDISFGALAKAQEAFAPNPRKRKLQQASDPTVEPENPTATVEWPEHRALDASEHRKPRPLPSRSSKHAPTVQSSRYAVSRRRNIFEPSASLKSRDPRFDPTVTTSNADPNAVDRANRNYSFLTSYQASEILDLKAQIKKARDPEAAAALKRQVMSLDSKMRAAEAKQREHEIVKRHKQKEKEAIKSGQKSKPYFIKRSEVRKEALAEKFNSMSKKARDKAMDRKRKRVKGKESKDMPRVRRERIHGES